jgi:hypothetical protein
VFCDDDADDGYGGGGGEEILKNYTCYKRQTDGQSMGEGGIKQGGKIKHVTRSALLGKTRGERSSATT